MRRGRPRAMLAAMGEMDLTRHLGEWRKRRHSTLPLPSDAPPPPRRGSAAPLPVRGAERVLRADGFMWLAYGLVVLFLAAQLGILAWLR